MFQFPLDPTPNSTMLPSTAERFVFFFLTYLIVLGLLAMGLPRLWFVALFKMAFQFVPETLERENE